MGELSVLVVEDDASVCNLVTTALELHGYRCKAARNATTALGVIVSEEPAVVLLDLGLPDMDGVEVIEKVRSWSNVPIIVVSSRSEDSDKIEALDAGADDYLTKPFSVDELLARLRTTFRRLASMRESTDEPSHLFVNGGLRIDYVSRSVFVDEVEVHLTPTEYDLLTLLAKNTGRVLTHTYILKEVWKSQLGSDVASLRVFMASLRKKIEEDPQAPRYIQTHVGIGYRMVNAGHVSDPKAVI